MKIAESCIIDKNTKTAGDSIAMKITISFGNEKTHQMSLYYKQKSINGFID